MSNNDLREFFGEIIHSYTREQALEDGVLVDVSEMAQEAGIVFPVALTSELYHGYVVPSPELEGGGQSVDGRLWDVLWMFRYYAQTCHGDRFTYAVGFLMEADADDAGSVVEVDLKAVVGPGDHGESVITIMLPHES